jgi:hypothetical protein
MITRVVHGWKVGGLVAYLLGPGRAQEHAAPRVIASWDGRDARWQPRRNGPLDTDLELGPLVRALRAPVVAAGLPEVAVDGKKGYVWHLSARVAAEDRSLSDAEWAGVARELLAGAGVADDADPGGPRWVAVRHAEDHIHVLVVLVRQDTARRFWPKRDYPKLRHAAGQVERRLGLTTTADPDGTAAPAPGRGEIEKAARQGREPARVELARAVRAAAVAVDGPAGFVQPLRAAGFRVELRRAPSGDLLGYKVARPGDVTAAGEPVFYSGSKLAPDLSLPRLARAWSAAGAVRGDPVAVGLRAVGRARRTVVAARGTLLAPDAADIAHATSAVLTAVAGWSPELARAAEMYDRAAWSPRGYPVVVDRDGALLRGVARQLLRRGPSLRPSGEPGPAGVALVVAVVGLLREIVAWHAADGRPQQAAPARAAADAAEQAVRGWTPITAAPSGRDLERAPRRALRRDGAALESP